MIDLFIHWNVDPVMFQIGSFGLRWYSFGFLFAFLFGYIVLNKYYKDAKVDVKLLDSLVVYIFLAVLIGARLGHCIFYEPDYFLTKEHWVEMIWPFHNGQFTGFQGLASHGAAFAILIALGIYCKVYKTNIWWVLDRLVIVVALGGTFIRLGNLFNSEIYGVETSLPWGVIFDRNGETVPKHPTQIYEALTYFTIYLVCALVYRKKQGQLHAGRLFGWWLVAVFGMRFLIEFVKNPQVDFEKTMPIDMGQILSLPFVIAGLVIVWVTYKYKLQQGPFVEKASQNQNNNIKK